MKLRWNRMQVTRQVTAARGKRPQPMARKLRSSGYPTQGKVNTMATNFGSYDQFSDDALMRRYFELSERPDEHADELASIDALIQSRLHAQYGAAEPGSSPRVRFAAPI